jgi:mannitol/fructose-specific phosphotransferase system IIA component (Ntr-type)
MKLSEVITEDLIFPDLKGTNVSSILREFSQAICDAGKFSSPDALYERLLQRENQESTGIGNGVAIPHCKVDTLNEVILAVGYAPVGVDFKAIDGNKTFFFFLVLAPPMPPVLHLRALAALSRLLKSSNFMTQLQKRPGKKELIDLIREEESTLVK